MEEASLPSPFELVLQSDLFGSRELVAFGEREQLFFLRNQVFMPVLRPPFGCF